MPEEPGEPSEPKTIEELLASAGTDGSIAGPIGTWPMPAGQYDPQLNGRGIKDGTGIYACFAMDFQTYEITPWAPPTAIAGYNKVDTPSEMTAGTWCLLTIEAEGVSYSYV